VELSSYLRDRIIDEIVTTSVADILSTDYYTILTSLYVNNGRGLDSALNYVITKTLTFRVKFLGILFLYSVQSENEAILGTYSVHKNILWTVRDEQYQSLLGSLGEILVAENIETLPIEGVRSLLDRHKPNLYEQVEKSIGLPTYLNSSPGASGTNHLIAIAINQSLRLIAFVSEGANSDHESLKYILKTAFSRVYEKIKHSELQRCYQNKWRNIEMKEILSFTLRSSWTL
jgi:hypothetical protein